jgi:hypothetical protein
MNTEVIKAVITLAEQTHILIFGEIHGTQEVPQLVSDYLERLQPLGYGALALEIPYSEAETLWRWATGETQGIPQFFSHPSGDGRGNEQVLALVRKATQLNFRVFCFDAELAGNWQERDRIMAENLLNKWEHTCPEKKVVCICGNLHSRLSPSSHTRDPYWPSFATNLQILKPDVVVQSINIVFHQGAFFNLRVQRLNNKPITDAYVTHDINDGHSLSLHLPKATPATHLTPPRRMGFFTLFFSLVPTMVARWINYLKPK